jgi:hypothetical protein
VGVKVPADRIEVRASGRNLLPLTPVHPLAWTMTHQSGLGSGSLPVQGISAHSASDMHVHCARLHSVQAFLVRDYLD